MVQLVFNTLPSDIKNTTTHKRIKSNPFVTQVTFSCITKRELSRIKYLIPPAPEKKKQKTKNINNADRRLEQSPF